MTVRELIAKLEKMPQDAEVVGYSHYSEDDHSIGAVESCLPSVEFFRDESGEDIMIYPPYYCQGDSVAEEIWLREKEGYKKPIVYLVDFTNYEH